MRHHTQPGSRSAPSIRLYSEVGQAIDADRLRKAEDFRLGQRARQGLSSRDRAARPRRLRQLRPSFARARLEEQ